MKKERILHPLRLKSTFFQKIFAKKIYFLVAVMVAIGAKIAFGAYVATRIPAVSDAVGDILALTSTPTPYSKPQVSYQLPAAKWVPQSFNNCGPAATSMVLQYFGYNVSQEETKAHLRTNPDDKNVFIREISNYLRNDYGIQNKVLIGGNLQVIKTLVQNGVYVVVEDWLHPDEDIGHVLIIRGFDDNEGVLVADDSYFGVGQKYSYKLWDESQWKPYNREYMPVYKSENEELVKSIVGENWDEKTMYQNSVDANLEDIKQNPDDMYAWFNLGSNYFGLGNFEKAKEAFEKSQSLGWPKRILWYNIDPVITYNKLGEYQKAIDTANLGLWYNDNFAEMHYEKYLAYRGLKNDSLAQSELQKALNLDKNISVTMD